VPVFEMVSKPEDRVYLTIGQNTRIGPNCTISAYNSIVIEENVVFGPNVMVVDHYHNYEDISKPVSNQGITSNGKILIQAGSWLGSNAVIYSSKNDLVVGKNSVVAANSVVRVSVPPYSIVSGNPAKIIKQYSFKENKWISVNE
jgi:acetyltransferase-like isoleucine patch superfamily enzyme